MGDRDFPYKAEYAKSGRAGCKLCRINIDKDTLRLAVMVQSPHFDGKVPNWHHAHCFWRRARVTDTSQIHGYPGLRWEDQQSIKKAMGIGGSSSNGASSKAKAVEQLKDPYREYTIEYAKTGKSKCRATKGCYEEFIPKGQVRIALKEYESERAQAHGPQWLWHHLDCFVRCREDLEFSTDMQPAKIPGYHRELSAEDKQLVIQKLGKGSDKPLKRKADDSAGAAKQSKKAKTDEDPKEKALREQSQLIWKMRDNLKHKVSKDALGLLLEFNGQESVSVRNEDRLLDRVTDGMVFGALHKCPECKKGQLVPGTTGYHCTGNMTEWTKCQHSTHEPKRKAWKVPEEFHDVDFLKAYKYKKREKVFEKPLASRSTSLVSSASKDGTLPLSGMTFVLGKSVDTDEVTRKIKALGGAVVTKMTGTVMAVIATKGEVKKNNKLMKDANLCDVHVVAETFLDAVGKGGAILMVTEHSICDWGSDPQSRVTEIKIKPVKSAYKRALEERSANMYTKSVPTSMKMTVKGGAAVDPESGLEDRAHILNERGTIWNVVLGYVDIAQGTNSYYKLQILESDSSSKVWLFRSWGRVGTAIGGTKLEDHGTSRVEAQHQFRQLYGEKSGNAWEDRANFQKYPGKMYPLDIDYGNEDDTVNVKLDGPSNSKLDKPVQELVRMIFDIESMKKAMLEYEIDLKKMPLGKLSKKQIESAYKVLTELTTLKQTGGSVTQLLDATNRFYTLIPHDFGMQKPPLLDSEEVIKTKTDMLDNLLEIEIAYSLLKGGDPSGKDPIDMHYEKLKTAVSVLEPASDEYQRLSDYVKNTHASTHTQYSLELQHVFKIDRAGEKKRFKPFRGLGNRQLLWHGSRLTNYAGILSQGLRIAPPEAPVTGYMFGKGIYFADMVSKSANYCATNTSNNTGLLLLCDVALGNMHELTQASYIEKLPKGKHSTKGIGQTQPDPSADVTVDDVKIPMGKGVPAGVEDSSLLYNEYIVYDTAQVNMKYLIQCKFNYKSLW